MSDHVDLMTERGEALLNEIAQNGGNAGSAVPWDVYPRPQLVRESFMCLNGEWDFCVSETPSMPEAFSGMWEKILVPFAPQSILSGIHRDIPDGSYLWYRRSVEIPAEFIDERVLLHIDAADQIAFAYVNGVFVGEHRGGYNRATFDITDALNLRAEAVADLATAEIVIRVYDRLANRVFPYGKQTLKRGGMWYTPVSGIWQSVWLESVPAEHIKGIGVKVTIPGDPENDPCCVDITVYGADRGTITLDAGLTTDIVDGEAHIDLPGAMFWSPKQPYLYYFTAESDNGDRVRSYFAVRTVDVREVDGINRICLNGEQVFLNGLLDQGYWSDGLLTPPAPECYADEIERLTELGFNTLRKHIKLETDHFYYECDRLGMLVMQDMVNNGEYKFMRDTVLPTAGKLCTDDTKLNANSDTRAEFEREMVEAVRRLKNHPCIVMWTIFNEGWGQFCGTDMYNRLREIDSTRLIDTASGWFAGCETDIESRHVYFRKVKMPKKFICGIARTGVAEGSAATSSVPATKPLMITEFGGYSWKPVGHCFNTKSTYAYGSYKTREDLVKAIKDLYEEQIKPLIPQGLCGAIYTQVSDVEDETNGIFSFDRKVQKVLPGEI